ncbi:MAG: phosphodiester glycosidase family protein, partial [Planctomycetota bacterium]
GGGSSTLWHNGRVVNSPSDGTPRPVGNALVLLSREK